MSRDTVETVIEVENEILARVEEEQNKAEQWLRGVRRETEHRLDQERRALESSIVRSREAAVGAAEKQAVDTVEAARGQADRLGNIDEAVLRHTIRRHLKIILLEER